MSSESPALDDTRVQPTDTPGARVGTETSEGIIYTRKVYDTCMGRTNIEIDDDLLQIVMRRYGIHTKTEAVDIALRRLAGRPLSTEEALAMRGARLIDEIPEDTGP